ncbi:MAG: hypothetical protein MJ093_02215 [Saccharofermentans sp.]|nr:hypothetical protein [Saccharofermentans sp.]
MYINYEDQAADSLSANVGKYITIYHKYNKSRVDNSCSQDVCVVKLVSICKGPFYYVPRIKVQFNNGKTAEFSYSVGYKGQIRLSWDYKRIGRCFNDMFICWNNGEWHYTYPDNSLDSNIDYYLTNGDLFINMFDSEEEAVETHKFYNETLKVVSEKREVERKVTGVSFDKKIGSLNSNKLDRVLLA